MSDRVFTAAQRFAFIQFQLYVHLGNEAGARRWYAKIGYDFPYEVGVHALQHLKTRN